MSPATHARRWRIAVSVSAPIFFIALVWFTVWATTTYQGRAVREARGNASYDRCIDSQDARQKINAYAIGAEIFAHVLLENARATHAVTARGTPMWRQQAINIRRIEAALQATEGQRLTVPTVADCEARRQLERSRG